MSAATAGATEKKGGKSKLFIILAAVLVLLGVGGWFSGVIPSLLGSHEKSAKAGTEGHAAAAEASPGPIFVDLPDIVTNLNTSTRRASFIKMKAKVEVVRQEDVAILQAAMPRVIDLFQSYLREVRPEELRGTAGTYRLREELVGRINVAAAPARITDVLFQELLVQ